MRKVVAGLLISLDGVVSSPNQWGWANFMNHEMTEGIAAGIAQSDAVLLGRRTYLDFANIWPSQSSDVPMADFLNHSPKYVVSSTLENLDWQPATLIKGDLARELNQLKKHPGKDILIPGSPVLVRSLLVAGLLDELSLNICPIIVGDGQRLFDEVTSQVRLNLAASKVFSTGVLSVTYQPAYENSGSSQPVTFPDASSRQ